MIMAAAAAMALGIVTRRDLMISCLRESRLSRSDRLLSDQPDSHEAPPRRSQVLAFPLASPVPTRP
jgi:hypothetical protein